MATLWWPEVLRVIILATLLSLLPYAIHTAKLYWKKKNKEETPEDLPEDMPEETGSSVLQCIRQRKSVFPRDYAIGEADVTRGTMDLLLEAAMWAPFHGSVPPWRFVVLGRDSMVEMQHVTLAYYDREFESFWDSWEEYRVWRDTTEDEIFTRWGPVSFMVAIIMRRQAGSKRIPEWEEAAATAAAVQNMHIQASADPHLACYWSSWHAGARDSPDMARFLSMGPEDKCMGMFIVAKNGHPNAPDRRRRRKENHVEWRE